MIFTPKKIRIVHIQVTPIFAGAVKFSYDILSNLDGNKYDKYLIFSESESVKEELRIEFVKKFEEAGIKTIGTRKLKRKIGFHDLLILFELNKIFKDINPHIVNSVSSKPWILCSILSFFFNRSFFLHTVQGLSWHSGTPFLKKKLYHTFELLASLGNEKILFVNKSYLQDFKFQKNKNIYIPNGLQFDNSIQPRILEEKNVVKLLFVGRIDPQKDVLSLIKAFYLAIISNPSLNVHLDVVGDDTIGNGLELKKVKDFIMEHPLIDKMITFHGWQSNIKNFLLEADVFISPSIYEGFGIVFLEAGNYYIPVISTNVDGIPEVVVHNHGGFLANKKDINQLSIYISKLVLDHQLRMEMGNFHGLYVRNNFSRDKIVEKYDNLYSNLVFEI
jgi:glycosyltransferase involved in cell wall biosynthesis